VPISQRVALEPGEYFQSDLLGCTVVDRRSGQPIGQVTAFDEGGGAGGLLVVGRDLLVPFARSICVEIDLEAHRILVDLPEGLRDLNPS
jgi:ribosomal 30S subunit maturation factor RimM